MGERTVAIGSNYMKKYKFENGTEYKKAKKKKQNPIYVVITNNCGVGIAFKKQPSAIKYFVSLLKEDRDTKYLVCDPRPSMIKER